MVPVFEKERSDTGVWLKGTSLPGKEIWTQFYICVAKQHKVAE
jgi:hypothetical protein